MNVSGITLTNTDAGNYTSNTTAATTADITARGLTVTAATNTKGYDSKIAGTGKTLTPAAVISDGNGGNNYLVTYANNITGVIDPGQIGPGQNGNETATDNAVSSLMTAMGKIALDMTALGK